MKCQLCDKELINCGDFWMHPQNPCQEGDGMAIHIEDEDLYKLFQSKYGKPQITPDVPLQQAKEGRFSSIVATLFRKRYSGKSKK